jgi:hypothetical protein
VGLLAYWSIINLLVFSNTSSFYHVLRQELKKTLTFCSILGELIFSSSQSMDMSEIVAFLSEPLKISA